MPNSANRSNNSSSKGKGKPEEVAHEHNKKPRPNPERSDLKHGDHPEQGGHAGDTSRSSSQGRKEASGGE